MFILKLKDTILKFPRNFKRIIACLIDCLCAIFSVWWAFYLRVGEFLPLFSRVNEHFMPNAWLLAVLVSIPVFTYFGLYRVIFRYAGGPALLSISKAFFVYSITYSFLISFIGIEGVPRTIGFIQPLVYFVMVCISRMGARFWLGDIYNYELARNDIPRALIYGAGKAGRELATALRLSEEVRVVGFLDDDEELQGGSIVGLTVFSPKNLNFILEKKNISKVFLALPTGEKTIRANIISKLSNFDVNVKTIPSASDLSQGHFSEENMRELTVDEILGREIVRADPDLLSKDIRGNSVLVTGAGGSIGSELCRQIIAQNPKMLILFDHNEFGLYKIHNELLKHFECNRLVPILGSVTHREDVEKLFAKHSPNTVYHAAAYKHVHLVEQNPSEGFKNNTIGTLILAECSIEANVNKFVLVSTDKAVRPTSVMGVSKKLSEMVLQGLSTTQNQTLFAIVRFGNVLNSSGSVVPIFSEQINNGGPVTVTHKEVTRYFMTIQEAASLVIQAGAMTMSAPEYHKNAPVYLLDMGKPVKIYDLAVKMIRLSGRKLKLNGDNNDGVEIQISNLKKGEKLFEELLVSKNAQETKHPKIFIDPEYAQDFDTIWNLSGQLEDYVSKSNVKKIRDTIAKIAH